MRRMTRLGGVVGLLAALAAAPMQAEVVVNESVDISLKAFVSCANGGAGEIVDLNGPLHVLTTFNMNGNHVNGMTHFQPQGITGVGESTGDKYQASGTTQDHFTGSLTDGQYSQFFVNNFKFVGKGPGNNFVVHENFHVTINADGEMTTFHDNYSADCK